MSNIIKKTDDCENKQYPFVSAVIVAAGNSTRMGGKNKQLLYINEVPVLIRTLRSFESSDLIKEIIVAAREEDIPEMYAMVKDYSVTKVKDIVKGGQTRQESVFNAIKYCSSYSEYIAIHDGARPLVTDEIIDKTIFAAYNFGAATTGTPVKDTVKVVDRENNIVSTPERDFLWAVQTPQVFNKRLYFEAMNSVSEGTDFTDDCKLIEEYGHSVKIVLGDYENIKITTPDDLIKAEIILNRRNNYEF